MEENKNEDSGFNRSAAKNICPLCGSISSVIAGQNNVFRKVFSVSFCRECELYYFNEKPSEEFLKDYYSGEYFSESNLSKVSYSFKSFFSKMRALSQYKYIVSKIHSSEGKSVLEIGSADGTFLSIFKRNGWNVRGLEFSDYMIKKAAEKHRIHLEKKDITEIDPEKEKFDLIAFPHVLEHLTDPLKILGYAQKLLKPNGFVFIELPFSPDYGEVSAQELSEYLNTTHLYDFRKKSLEKLIVKAGLTPLFCDRFFYPVPKILKKSGKTTGKILMTGSFKGKNLLSAFPVFLTVSNIYFRSVKSADPMDRIRSESSWRGLGDNIRIIAGINT